MVGFRGSVAILSDISLRLRQSVSFHGVRAQCISIKAGMEIPDNKRLEYALPYIHGIGRARARQILSELNMDNKLAKDLTKREVYVLGEQLSKYILGKELRHREIDEHPLLQRDEAWGWIAMQRPANTYQCTHQEE
ncbi:hypothetical protein FNV43_RR10893 [Rhamnella rubrinervis]|uniref:Ribosomal protein S13 n=1 Tax=Rhamnella rubrinervis TaxID=2594499 RepID=A0A8K0MH85_9ROSA|nr:hypothetical protein FNV43_RR10893 [Rhamnella rubrinervis]